jgi:hypothetical protein
LAAHNGEGPQIAAQRAGFEAAFAKFDRKEIVNELRAFGLEPERLRAAA